MKYTYAYKTSDGIRHEDSMSASSREEVFAELRKRGIKAIKVVAADGSKANGEVRGIRKRAVAALVALAAVFAGVVAYFSGTRTAAVVAANSAISSPRHQIYGDPAIMEPIENIYRRRLARFKQFAKSSPTLKRGIKGELWAKGHRYNKL